MERREFIKSLAAGASILMLPSCLSLFNRKLKPNIIFILVDDLGWRDLSCYGSEFYETPNIDKLAKQGMIFTNAYASCPVCSPTRACILTGKYPARLGVTDWIDELGTTHPLKGKLIDAPYIKHLPGTEKTIASAMSENGYSTWHVGKWHLGSEGSLPEDFGFEVNIGGCGWGSPQKGGYFSPWTLPSLKDKDVPPGTYLTDYLTDKAIELIDKKDERPFFLNMWYYSVHKPVQAKTEKIKKYEAKMKRMGLDKINPVQEGEISPTYSNKKKYLKRRIIQSDPAYAAMIESLDENIGRLLQKVEDINESENTVVIFTSDNGGLSTAKSEPPTSNKPLNEGKGWAYEGGTREPLFIKWPGKIKAGTKCDVPVTSTDFFPTILNVAGLKEIPEQHVDGENLLPLLKGGKHLDREAIFWHYPHYGNQGGTPASAVRKGDYKLIEFYEDGRLELYNLKEDISESINLAAIKKEKTRELHNLLNSWKVSIEAKLPRLNPDYKK